MRVLQEENEQLRHQMKEMMKKMEEKSGHSDWSEVSVGSPRQQRGGAGKREEVRFTPNGTQIPLGPPPVDKQEEMPPVPPWPFPEWEIYERDEGGRARRMELESMEWQLHRRLPGGGIGCPDMVIKEVVKFQAAGLIPDREYVIKEASLELRKLIERGCCFESWCSCNMR